MKRYQISIATMLILAVVFLIAGGCAMQGTAETPVETPFLTTTADELAAVTPVPSPTPASSQAETTTASTAKETALETTKAPVDVVPDFTGSPRIIVKKGERVLELWSDDELYNTYSIGLGREPEGDKQTEGDGRTPEGTYYVCLRNSVSRFYLSLGVSYPNREDAEDALAAGTINQSTYRQIADAEENKTRPPWNTAMGGAIMIHGMGGSSDWTAGCIAVDNDVMDILWEHCPNKTPIIIKP